MSKIRMSVKLFPGLFFVVKSHVRGFSTTRVCIQKFNEPLSGHEMPRAGGIASMMRLPVQDSSQGLDACFVGIPLDIGTSNRSGTRYGPRQIRSESTLLRKVNISTGANPFDSMQVADVGDVNLNLYHLPKACEDIRKYFSNLITDGCIPLAMGGDHTLTYPILQAMKEKYGPVGLVHFDAHTDCNDTMLGEKIAHGTPMRRAFEEGCLVGNKVIQIGLRGSNYKLSDYDWGREQGFRLVEAHECWHKPLTPLMEEVRQMMGNHPVYISFDIDGLDPSYAPGTGTPEIGGLTSIQGLEIVRGCRGLNIVGCDLVEVSPPYDVFGTTALHGANLLFEMLCVLPKSREGCETTGYAQGLLWDHTISYVNGAARLLVKTDNSVVYFVNQDTQEANGVNLRVNEQTVENKICLHMHPPFRRGISIDGSRLSIKEPVKSSGYEFNQNEYTSPRANKTAPSKKQFLEDVLTAMKMEENKRTDKGRTDEGGNDDTVSKDSQTSHTSGSSSVGSPRKSAIPRLDMSKLREKREKQNKSEKGSVETSKPEYKLKSKTHTIIDHKHGSENRKAATSSAKGSSIKSKDKYDKLKDLTELAKKAMGDSKTDSLSDIDKAIKVSKKKAKDDKSKELIESGKVSDKGNTEDEKTKETIAPNKGSKLKDSKITDTVPENQNLSSDKIEENKKIESNESLPRQHSKIASELAQRVRSSGYGAPVNPKLRPVSLKPRSANMLPSKMKRESSATSSKSLSVSMNREKSKPILAGKGQSKWELVETPITEELSKKGAAIEKENTKTTLEKEDPSPTTSTRTKTKPKDNQTKIPLQSIDELLREESTGSILDPSVLQERLSSIKKKVEVRRRGRDSRSSYSSDLDSTLDSSFDTTLGKDKLNTSFGDSSAPSSTNRTSSRSNITRISKQFRSTKVK